MRTNVVKKTLKVISAVLLICVTLLTSLVSCGDDDGFKRYAESGIIYELPIDMKKLSVNYADICHGNGEAEFMVYLYGRDALLSELYLKKDSTVKEYADWFVNNNGYVGVTEVYDEANSKIVLEYIYLPENTYYRDYIIANEHALFHVTFLCDAELRDKYSPVFDEWQGRIDLDY